jgi:VanZ family protein
MTRPAALRPAWIWGPVLAYLALIFYLSSLSRVPWTSAYPDYLLHGLEYFGLATLLARALNNGLRRSVPGRLMLLSLALCTLCGIVDEIYQWWTPDRLSDYRDVLSDAAGAGLGLLALGLAQRLVAHRVVSGGNPLPGEAVLFTRPGCPLCYALHRAAARAARRAAVPLRVVDITHDATLASRYKNEVPVLLLPGGRRLQGRVEPGEVEAAFREAVQDGGRLVAGDAERRAPDRTASGQGVGP